MGLFDVFGGNPWAVAFGAMLLDEAEKEQELEQEKQEFADKLREDAAVWGLEYTDEEIEEILRESEEMGLFGNP